jgi:hypothetical protein
VKLAVDGWLAGRLRKEGATLCASLSNNILDLEVILRTGRRISLREYSAKPDSQLNKGPRNLRQHLEESTFDHLVAPEELPDPVIVPSVRVEPSQALSMLADLAVDSKEAVSVPLTGKRQIKDSSGFIEVRKKGRKKESSRRFQGKGTPVRDPFPGSLGEGINALYLPSIFESSDDSDSMSDTYLEPKVPASKTATPEQKRANYLKAKEEVIRYRLGRIKREIPPGVSVPAYLEGLKMSEPELYGYIRLKNQLWRNWAIEQSLPGYEIAHENRITGTTPPSTSTEVGGPLVRSGSEVLQGNVSKDTEKAI